MCGVGQRNHSLKDPLDEVLRLDFAWRGVGMPADLRDADVHIHVEGGRVVGERDGRSGVGVLRLEMCHGAREVAAFLVHDF